MLSVLCVNVLACAVHARLWRRGATKITVYSFRHVTNPPRPDFCGNIRELRRGRVSSSPCPAAAVLYRRFLSFSSGNGLPSSSTFSPFLSSPTFGRFSPLAGLGGAADGGASPDRPAAAGGGAGTGCGSAAGSGRPRGGSFGARPPASAAGGCGWRTAGGTPVGAGGATCAGGSGCVSRCSRAELPGRVDAGGAAAGDGCAACAGGAATGRPGASEGLLPGLCASWAAVVGARAGG